MSENKTAVAQPASKPSTTQAKSGGKDLAGNPYGTLYNEFGKAVTQKGEVLEGYNHLPQDEKNSFLYNEDGTPFKIPENAAETEQLLKHDITAKNVSINKLKTMLDAAKEMLAATEDESGKVFLGKNIASQEAAIESQLAARKELEDKLQAHKMSLITPGQRRDVRRLSEIANWKKFLQDEEDEIKNRLKMVTGSPSVKPTVKTSGKGAAAISTDETKANLDALVKEHGSQGKAIVALVKQGWLNHEIAAHMGISPASVPGPKNTFLRSAEGSAYEADAEGRHHLRA